MATVRIDGNRLTVRLSAIEKVAGLLRDIEVPLQAVTAVEVEPDGLTAARGVRAPGLAIPGRRKIGTWRGRGTKRMVSVRAGQPAIRLTVTGQRHDELLLGHDDPTALASRISSQT
jgi:hypothetical protein